ncbi:ABC transporter permease [Stieleria sp. TO1_6]|uniref:ABC transporter permease n=1 Tax=Stieleria tagensis TaxID=2956795 RepID=UPI00209ADC8B|nr:ABC transporter permease [Stieleria tagensis]MCO8121484.1 ABC transporter permease [Stieleria tagensis]
MATIDTTAEIASPHSDWLDKLDRWCARTGDRINPILVKETRQSLKSRQFVVTFSMILFAALAWTIAGSLSMMPQIYTTPSAPRMMIGYYAVLALPMLMVVPIAAYRSLEAEIDDGTLELLSITALSPWQIVLGKLGSASLQMLLYFVTLFPCLAYAYSLRGVDLPTTLLIVASLGVAGLLLTVVGLFFAPTARGRSGRVSALLALIFLLVLAEYAMGAMVFGMIFYGNPLSQSELLFYVVASTAVAFSLGHLMLTSTAAQLTPETENRSTAVRLSLLAFTTVCVSTIALAVLVLRSSGLPIYFFGMFVIAGVWTFCGALMVGERSTITPRIRRELPSSFLGRLVLTWLTPGPTTGLVFTIIVLSILTVMQQASLSWISRSGIARGIYSSQLRRFFGQPALLFVAYLISFLVIVRLLMYVIRLRNNPRVELGLAALVVVALMAALIPYSMQLHYNDYQPLTYDPKWQMTNWAFTMASALERRLPPNIISNVVGAAVGLGTIAILAAWKTTRPRRTATPERVLQELEKKPQGLSEQSAS